jgi:hypothetical protein
LHIQFYLCGGFSMPQARSSQARDLNCPTVWDPEARKISVFQLPARHSLSFGIPNYDRIA